MLRWTEIAALPLIAGALSAAAALLVNALGVDAVVAGALGLAAFAAAMAVRAYAQSETDRPLLAEELGGVHDRIEALEEDAADLRELLTDLAAIVEESALREQTTIRALSERLALLEQSNGAAPEALQAATMQTIQQAVGPITDRLEHFDARTRKLALALEKGLGANGLTANELSASPESADTEATVEAEEAVRPAPQPAPEHQREVYENHDPVSERAAGRADAERPDRPQFDERVDELGRHYALMMQAVFSVPDGEPRFFEAFTRRIGENGDIAPVADHIDEAKAAGQMGAIDNLLLVRSVATAEQLRSGGRDVSVFCNLSIQSLRDPAYLRAFVAFLRKNKELSRHLIFEFSQSELDDFCDADIDILQRLRETGFVFSIDHLEDWSIDIANLAKIGFRYVKLDAATLLQRESRNAGAVKRLVSSFDRVGIALVVEKVESMEAARALAAAGARFLQGAALVEPRLIRVDDEAFSDLEDAARRAVAGGRGLSQGGEGGSEGDGGGAGGAQGADGSSADETGSLRASRQVIGNVVERAIEAVGRGGALGDTLRPAGGPAFRRTD